MRVTVVSGSPKGQLSITLKYLEFMEMNAPGCEFDIFHVGHEIKKIEKKPELLERIIESVEGSDAVLWCFPVYVLLVPSQLKRFIELVFEGGHQGAFDGKYATAITTSIHFYDDTAHDYIRGISEDLGMRYISGYSAHMRDLLSPRGRESFTRFIECFMDYLENERPTARLYRQFSYVVPEYVPKRTRKVSGEKGQKVLLLTDTGDTDSNLDRMIQVFTRAVPDDVEVVNLNDVDIRGGCMGCLRCGYDGVCFYKDGVMDLFKEKIMPADAIVYAGDITDRFLSSRWKMFMDRAFFNGHRPVLMEKQMGFLISGPLQQLPDLRRVLEAHAQVGMMSLAGFVTDEYEDSEQVTSLVQDLARRMVWGARNRYIRPRTFLEVGGHKLFRDFIYNGKFVFKADHDFYREHGLFDFPQKKVGQRAVNLVVPTLLKIPRVREKFERDLKGYMVKPYEKVLEK